MKEYTLEELVELLHTYEYITDTYEIENKMGLYNKFKFEIQYLKRVIKKHCPDWEK